MKRLSLVTLLLALALQGCVSNSAQNQTSSAPFDSTRPCATNFSATGSLMAGQQFKTFEDFPGKTQAGAFDSLIPTISSGGYQIVNVNKDAGIINASQAGSMGGRAIPLNFVIQNTPAAGVHVEVSIVLTAGVATSSETIKKEFCRMLAAIDQSTAPTVPQSAGNNATTGKKPTGSTPGIAQITADQSKNLQNTLALKQSNPSLVQAISEASKSITNFTEMEGCINTWNSAKFLNRFAAPEAYFGTPPILRANYHEKSSCMSVLRFQGWAMPAKNAIKYQVVYASDTSGESFSNEHELVKQPSGEWLFKH